MATNETLEPARGARAESDGWAGLRIDDPLEVQQLLRQLLTGGVPVHLVSAQGDALSAQLGWLDSFAVPRAIFSHFGKGPIEMGERALSESLRELAREKAPECQVTAARDGLRLRI